MVTLCWAAKGGSGTTVVAASFALNSTHPSLLVDLDGELPAALGLPEPERPGVAEWLATDSPAEQLAELLIGDRPAPLAPAVAVRRDVGEPACTSDRADRNVGGANSATG